MLHLYFSNDRRRFIILVGGRTKLHDGYMRVFVESFVFIFALDWLCDGPPSAIAVQLLILY